MGLNEADTRAKLIDPALHARGWTEDLIRREESAGAVDVVDGRPRRRARGRVDYTLRVKVNPTAQPVAMALLDAWEKFLHDRSQPPLIQIALAHFQFEAIHPFLDGNGRVGRLLITVFLVERGVLPSPLLYLSAFFEATRRDYYEHLRGVQERGGVGGVVDLLPQRGRPAVRGCLELALPILQTA